MTKLITTLTALAVTATALNADRVNNVIYDNLGPGGTAYEIAFLTSDLTAELDFGTAIVGIGYFSSDAAVTNATSIGQLDSAFTAFSTAVSNPNAVGGFFTDISASATLTTAGDAAFEGLAPYLYIKSADNLTAAVLKDVSGFTFTTAVGGIPNAQAQTIGDANIAGDWNLLLGQYDPGVITSPTYGATIDGIGLVSPIPEPSTFALLFGGAAFLMAARRRRK